MESIPLDVLFEFVIPELEMCEVIALATVVHGLAAYVRSHLQILAEARGLSDARDRDIGDSVLFLNHLHGSMCNTEARAVFRINDAILARLPNSVHSICSGSGGRGSYYYERVQTKRKELVLAALRHHGSAAGLARRDQTLRARRKTKEPTHDEEFAQSEQYQRRMARRNLGSRGLVLAAGDYEQLAWKHGPHMNDILERYAKKRGLCFSPPITRASGEKIDNFWTFVSQSETFVKRTRELEDGLRKIHTWLETTVPLALAWDTPTETLLRRCLAVRIGTCPDEQDGEDGENATTTIELTPTVRSFLISGTPSIIQVASREKARRREQVARERRVQKQVEEAWQKAETQARERALALAEMKRIKKVRAKPKRPAILAHAWSRAGANYPKANLSADQDWDTRRQEFLSNGSVDMLRSLFVIPPDTGRSCLFCMNGLYATDCIHRLCGRCCLGGCPRHPKSS